MHPYWIDIEGRLGVGITAESRDDALAIFEDVFGSRHRPANVRAIEDMRDLEQNHVAPNMGNWFKRGVWYPGVWGYEQDWLLDALKKW
jgi:hypothetical protein